MSDVRSKNLYELLGNDPEEDSDREPSPPTSAVTKPGPRYGKREGPSEPPRAANPALARPRGGRGGRYGNEQAFRDPEASARANRKKPVDAPLPDVPTGVVKNRDARGNLLREDRTNRSDRTETTKQVEQGWGATSGESAWEDERAGAATAKRETKEGPGGDAAANDAEAAEAEDKAKSYAEYLAEQAEQRRDDLGIKEARKPNEGVKADKKWATAKALKRDEDEEAYIKGKEEKARREKARKEKAFVEVDMRFVEQPRGNRGGRGGGRGGAGGRGRGGAPGGAGHRGGRGGPAGGPAAGPSVDEKNFPALGGK
ncbi:elicitor protein [Histoplasma capsulatum var. duboisii H88]|uniref:Elicitor protein n=1 Tax=Ajellomyces capsulatus (strain H88) TaxID=544711 RepID=F0UDB7_AJEC8|nr:elicitor protein [Histoplasma capsulatum var. duboisii H88]QSS49677.1 elicitor protein [Histoplasma capsulatum var. duboisii H88]